MPRCPAAALLYDTAVTLAPTPMARYHASQARAAASLAADDAEYQADPAGYRLRADAHDAALAADHYYYPHY